MAQQFGNENRDTILPTISPLSSPAANYNPTDQLPNPAQLGIHKEGSIEMVVKSFGGLAYYMDMIGFGSKSTPFTAGQPFPMGSAYFMQTGGTCDNGANMWYYVNGIPTGNALGNNVKNAIQQMGMPVELKGLAPGIIEDAKDALDPKPIMSALFSKGYPRCKKITAPVGDFNKQIMNADGEYYIEDPTSVITLPNGYPAQEKWVQDTDSKGNSIFIDKKTFDCTPKAFAPDGSRLPDDKIPPLDPICSAKEGFLTEYEQNRFIRLGVALLLASVALFIGKMKTK